MAIKYVKGNASTLQELTENIVTYVTNETIHGSDVWTLIQNESFPYGTVIKAPAHADNEYQYIQLVSNRINVGSTYSNWFYNSGECSDYIPKTQGNTSYTLEGPDSGALDIFKTSAYVLSFSVNKQFSSGLKFYQQGGKIRVDPSSLGLLPQIKNVYLSGAWQGFNTWVPPVYPMVPYPSLSLDDEHAPTSGGFTYWIVKDRHTLTVVIYVNGVWQSVSCGLFTEIDQDSYSFPAFIAGGTIGTIGSGYQKFNKNAVAPSPISGVAIDYSITAGTVSNGNLLSAGSMGSISQFVYMRPDGQWKWLYNYTQSFLSLSGYVPSGHITNYYFPSTKPQRTTKNVIYPNNSDKSKLIDVYSIDTDNIKMLWHIMMLGHDTLSDYRGIIGFVPNNYMVSGKPAKYGQQKVGTKNVLIIPNGWDNRINYYPYHVGVYPTTTGSDSSSDPTALKQEMDSIILDSDMAYLAIDLGE